MVILGQNPGAGGPWVVCIPIWGDYPRFWHQVSNAPPKNVPAQGRSAYSSPQALYDHLQCIGHTIKTTTRRIYTQYDRPKRDCFGRQVETAYDGTRAYNGDFNQETDWRNRVPDSKSTAFVLEWKFAWTTA